MSISLAQFGYKRDMRSTAQIKDCFSLIFDIVKTLTMKITLYQEYCKKGL